MKRNSFIFLNLTQFFSALNDNIYKLLLVFQLIAIQGESNSNTILSLVGAIFVLPFLLFASLAGSLADRYSKKTIIFSTRLIELFVVSLGVLAFFFKNATLGYFVLFLMATQSALFSPSKYGIIPEIVKKEDISKYNGILTATTYLAIILGTFFASFLSDISGRNFLFASFFCMIIAILGALTSMKIKKTHAQASYKKVSARLLSDIYKTLKNAKKIRYLFSVIIFGAYFLFLGAYVQLNMIPFTIESLQMSEIQGGYLFIMTAIGIGIGSFFAGKISGKEVELGMVPIAAFLLVVTLVALYLFQENFYVVSVLLILLGIFGGFYVVPIDAYIQVASPNQNRGENLAAANFLNFLGVIFASFLLFLFGNVFRMTAAQGFFAVAGITFLLAIVLIFLIGDQVARFLLAKLARPFWKLKIVGKEKINLFSPIVIVGKRNSWLDTVILMSTLPRLMRIIVPIDERFKRTRSLLYRLICLTPVENDIFLNSAIDEVEKELKRGHSVCLLYPPKMKTPIGNLPHVTIKIEGVKKIKDLFSIPLKVTYKTPCI